jgi:hypothetical protein
LPQTNLYNVCVWRSLAFSEVTTAYGSGNFTLP